MDQDTDSEPGGDSTPSENGNETRKAGKPGEDEGGLSVEEFTRLQDELMALKMYNQELMGERRWLQQQAPLAAASGPRPSGASTSTALGRRMQFHMKASTEALAGALGSRGVASLGVNPTAKLGPDEKDLIRSEAESVKSRIRTTLEEVQEFNAVADDAQQVIKAAATRAECLKDLSGLEPPTAASLRSSLGSMPIVALDDETLQRFAAAVLRLVCPGKTERDGAQDKKAEEDVHCALIWQKINVQREELDRLLEIFHKQQEQVIKYQDQISGREDERNKGLHKQVKDKLKDKEKQVDDLVKQLESSEAASRQSLELKQQLRDFLDQAASRDHVLGDMRSMLEQQAASDALLRERLDFTQEDLRGLALKRQWSHVKLVGTLVPASPSTKAEASPVPSVGGEPQASFVAAKSVEVQADLAGDSLVALQQRNLQQSIDDLRIEISLVEKRAAREVRELEGLVRDQRQAELQREEEMQRQRLAEKEERERKIREEREATLGGRHSSLSPSAASPDDPLNVPADVEHHDISSDGEGDIKPCSEPTEPEEAEPYPAGLAYVQRVEELEAQSDELKGHLEALHEVERSLRQDNKEKNDLIAVLMRRAKLPESGMDDAQKRPGSQSSWYARRGSGNPEEEARELNCVIEDTTEDNIRLRNDIKIMSDELRKLLVASEP